MGGHCDRRPGLPVACHTDCEGGSFRREAAQRYPSSPGASVVLPLILDGVVDEEPPDQGVPERDQKDKQERLCLDRS